MSIELRLAALVALLAAAFFGYTAVVHKARDEGRQQTEAAHAAADLRQAQQNAATRVRQTDNAADIDRAHAAQVARLQALAASRAADLQRVRNDLAAAVGPAAAASAPAACGPDAERAAVLAGLLDEGLGLAEEGRGRVEELAEQVTQLQAYATRVCRQP
ncbi:MAG TPA: hypothetical protein PLL72_03820 [Burkholderiaceae bacterium]|nr:hypothetical protein [Burkholderiaceae bacterium]